MAQPTVTDSSAAELNPVEREVIALLAAFSFPEPLSIITRGLVMLGVRLDKRVPSNERTAALLASLVQRGLIEREQHSFSLDAERAHAERLALARTGRLQAVARVVRALRPAYKDAVQAGNQAPTTPTLAVRELRFALYGQDWTAARALAERQPRVRLGDALRPFDLAFVKALPEDLRLRAAAGSAERAMAELTPVGDALGLLASAPRLNDQEHGILVEGLLLRGAFDDAERRVEGRDSLEADVARGALALLRGRPAEAVVSYEAAAARRSSTAYSLSAILGLRLGLLFPFALLAHGGRPALRRVDELLTQPGLASGRFTFVPHIARGVLEFVRGRDGKISPPYYLPLLQQHDFLEILLYAAALQWTGQDLVKDLHRELAQRRTQAIRGGYTWVAAQATDLLAALAAPKDKLPPPPAELPGVRLATLVGRPERWRDTLADLAAIAALPPPPAKPTEKPARSEKQRRLVWVLRFEYGASLEPREQTRGSTGWSKGRAIALRRLYESMASLEYLSSADRAACKAITATTGGSWRYKEVYFNINVPQALLALAQGGVVLAEEPDGTLAPCEVRQGAPRIVARRVKQGFMVTLEPTPMYLTDRLAVIREPGAAVVVEFTDQHFAIAEVLGPEPLLVPAVGEEALRAALGALADRVVILGDLDTGDAAQPGEPRPCFLLRPRGEGLGVAAHVRPLGPEGPLARPGEGGAQLVAPIDGRPRRAARDLAEETRRLAAALAACPTLAALRGGGLDFVVPDRERSLEVVLELRALGDAVRVEWPEGEALRVTDAIGDDQLKLSVREGAGGFLLRGELALPEHEDLDFGTLIDYLSASPTRFLQLGGDGRYFALSPALRARLTELLGFGDRSGRGLKIPGLLAPLCAELLEGVKLSADAGWRRQLERFAASATGEDPPVPATLRAELRPYQAEGFRWLLRLGRWGAGACLADDMGLGKTVQAIALLLARAEEGPALVIAPTSVVPTWLDELRRFAPTLQVHAHWGATRPKELGSLGPFDVLLTSHSILPLDIDALEPVAFGTVILDEAQGIKNAATRRAQAARRLRAGQRVATTGTPIENRLDDLHSIFSFLNPGLLGSAESFQARFARPIERDRDPAARERLRRLVAPFVLRRTKTQVLPELPPRTEVTLRVPLEPEEAALYEAVRQKALEELAAEAASGPEAGKRRMQLLAAITRLRQAASHARLLVPEAPAESSKLAALGELLDDLLPTRHRLLVFSQFVGHLALVRQFLEGRGVSYQYLDGATPLSARKKAIDAFQRGEGDVFLISLKAGGSGLNLTAADYVVHMDPWWNPAAEDQASDRAHRIGQARPVTIYRLVAQDTIEDRILSLHHRKRELAAGILSGSELVGAMSEAELLALLRDPV